MSFKPKLQKMLSLYLRLSTEFKFSHKQKQGGHKQNTHKVSTESTTDSAQANSASKNINFVAIIIILKYIIYNPTCISTSRTGPDAFIIISHVLNNQFLRYMYMYIHILLYHSVPGRCPWLLQHNFVILAHVGTYLGYKHLYGGCYIDSLRCGTRVLTREWVLTWVTMVIPYSLDQMPLSISRRTSGSVEWNSRHSQKNSSRATSTIREAR